MVMVDIECEQLRCEQEMIELREGGMGVYSRLFECRHGHRQD